MKNARLYYVYDPMCSWCWGYRPIWLRLLALLPSNIEVKYRLGGLAPDSDAVMGEEMQELLQQTWRRIERELNTEFNFDFWSSCTPRRSTYMACRAMLAAELQGEAEKMLLAIQQAYYLHALNPSDTGVLLDLAEGLGLDRLRFDSDMHSQAVQKNLEEQMALVRRWPISGFPSLVLECEGLVKPVRLDYKNEQVTLTDISRLLNQANIK